MVKLINKILPTAKLPLDVCRGTVKERYALAHKYTKKFIKNLDKYYPDTVPLSVDGYRKCLDETLAPYKIDYYVKKQEGGDFGGTLEPVYKIVCPDEAAEIAYVENGSFNVYLQLDKSGHFIKSKRTAIHETRHFFDHICNPKTNALDVNEQFNTDGVDDICTGIHDMTFVNDYFASPYSKGFIDLYKQSMNSALDKLEPRLKIEILQKIRYSLITEINAYNEEINYLKRGGLIKRLKNSLNIYLYKEYVNNQARFAEKLDIVTDLLKNVMKKERQNLNI